jgi:23S rRNA (uridine2552-2'-O)-methyltransferase
MSDDKTDTNPFDTPAGERKRLVKAPTRGKESGARHKAVRLKNSHKLTPSSQAWLSRQLNDPFVAEAKAKGYRSRAAFKILELDEKIHFLKQGQRIVDLGCAPGGWVQMALAKGAANVVGVDLLPVEPLPPATMIQMDFTDPDCGDRLIELLGGPPDVILSDMAPNTIGHRQTDHLRIVGLIEAAVDFTLETLKPGGVFVTKAFQGGEMEGVLRSLKANFAEVKHVKPKASRAESSEVYLVATGFKGR